MGLGIVLLTACSSQRTVSRAAETSMQTDNDTLSLSSQRKFDYFFLEAIRQKEKGNYGEAYALLEHCLNIKSNASTALFEIAPYYILLKQPERMFASLKQSADNAPDNYWYSSALVNYYRQQNKNDEAISLLETMAKRFPQRRETLYALAEMYGTVQDYNKQIETLNKLENLVGKSEEISTAKIEIYYKMKDYKKAYSEIEKMITEYPANQHYRIMLADTYLEQGRKEDALAIYKKILEKEPGNVEAHLSLAAYYEDTQQKDSLQQQLDSLLMNDKVPADTRIEIMKQMIAKNEQEGGDSTKVIKLFEQIIDKNPDDDQMPLLYGQYLWAKNLKNNAVKPLEKALAIDPTNKAARLMLLETAVKNEDMLKVDTICTEGIEATPEVIEFYFYEVLFCNGGYNVDNRINKIIELCKKGIKLINNDTDKNLSSDFYAILGDTYFHNNQHTEAYAAYDSSLVYNPANMGTLNNYAFYLSLDRKELDKAEEMSFKTVKAEPNNATYLDTYAWILFIKGKYAEAKIYIDLAVKNSGRSVSSDILEHCGDIYAKNGKTSQALKYWIKAYDAGSESNTLDAKIKKKKYIAK